MSRISELTADEIGGWIIYRLAESESGGIDAARWRVLLAAFLDATTRGVFPPQERRPDCPQWDIISLLSALDNYGRHHGWCALTSWFGQCNCGYNDALRIGQYARLSVPPKWVTEERSDV